MYRTISACQPYPSIRALCFTALFFGSAAAQDAQRGAMLYMRLPNDVASCVSCHGPDPGQNHNNILRAADSPATLVKVINTTSRMGYLRSELSDADTRDITAFLGAVVRTLRDTSAMQVWPWTLEFGSMLPGQDSATQWVRIRNPSSSKPLPVERIATNSPDVSLTHACPPLLAQGASCDVKVQLRPSARGLQRAALQLSAGGQTSVVGIVGYGASLPVSALTWSPLGNVELTAAQGGLARTSLTLHNTGTMPAVLALTSISGPQADQFRIESGCANGSVVQAGTSCTLTLSYMANLFPQSAAVLQLRSDQTNPPAVLLQGSSTAAAVPVSPTNPPLATGGSAGGCASTTSQSHHRDATLWIALIAAILLVAGRRQSVKPFTLG